MEHELGGATDEGGGCGERGGSSTCLMLVFCTHGLNLPFRRSYFLCRWCSRWLCLTLVIPSRAVGLYDTAEEVGISTNGTTETFPLPRQLQTFERGILFKMGINEAERKSLDAAVH